MSMLVDIGHASQLPTELVANALAVCVRKDTQPARPRPTGRPAFCNAIAPVHSVPPAPAVAATPRRQTKAL